LQIFAIIFGIYLISGIFFSNLALKLETINASLLLRVKLFYLSSNNSQIKHMRVIDLSHRGQKLDCTLNFSKN